MNNQDKAKLGELARAATGGPWETGYRFGVAALVQTPGRYSLAITDILPRAAGVQDEQEANAAYIAAANPAAVLALLDELERANQARVSLAQDVIALAEHCGELADLSDGPCRAQLLCGEYACEQVGCIKLKADAARQALGAPHE